MAKKKDDPATPEDESLENDEAVVADTNTEVDHPVAIVAHSAGHAKHHAEVIGLTPDQWRHVDGVPTAESFEPSRVEMAQGWGQLSDAGAVQRHYRSRGFAV